MANSCSEPSGSNIRELTTYWYTVNSVVVYAVLFHKLGKCLLRAAACQKKLHMKNDWLKSHGKAFSVFRTSPISIYLLSMFILSLLFVIGCYSTCLCLKHSNNSVIILCKMYHACVLNLTKLFVLLILYF